MSKLSFWEQDHLKTADYLVIGAGIIGLSTAIELAQLHPTARIVLLEQGVLPHGATTRNAGFACFGSLTELLDDIKTLGADAALKLVEQRHKGLQLLRSRLSDEQLGYEANGGYEVLTHANKSALHAMDEVNQLLYHLFKRPVFHNATEKLPAMGFAKNWAQHLIFNPMEGQLHSGKLFSGLLGIATSLGVRFHSGSRVIGLEGGSRPRALIASAVTGEFSIRAGQIAVCTNGYLRDLFPETKIVPARGQVLVSEIVADLPFRGCFHLNSGYDYFRDITTPDGMRILVGGGRNLNRDAEESTKTVNTVFILSYLEQLLAQINGGKPLKISYSWAGIMGFAPDKQIRIHQAYPNVWVGFGCNGMGIALGSLVASELAAKMTGGRLHTK